jgi:hypothetical protein
MKLVKDINGMSKTYEGRNGTAVLTRNFGSKDRGDKWSVSVEVNGEFKRLASRAEFKTAYALAEQKIG